MKMLMTGVLATLQLCTVCLAANPWLGPQPPGAAYPLGEDDLQFAVLQHAATTYYTSYSNLAPKFGFVDYGDLVRTIPGKFGARASKLYDMLSKGHHKVKLSPEEMRRITLWLDSVCCFYGVYEQEGCEAQLKGLPVKPSLE